MASSLELKSRRGKKEKMAHVLEKKGEKTSYILWYYFFTFKLRLEARLLEFVVLLQKHTLFLK